MVTAQRLLLSTQSLDSTDKCRPVARNDNLGLTNYGLNVVITGAEVQEESGNLSRNLQWPEDSAQAWTGLERAERPPEKACLCTSRRRCAPFMRYSKDSSVDPTPLS